MLRRFAVLLLMLVVPALCAQTYNPALFSGMKWRGIGPYRGGRVLAVTGVPGEPGVYYFGGGGRRRVEDHRFRRYLESAHRQGALRFDRRDRGGRLRSQRDLCGHG